MSHVSHFSEFEFNFSAGHFYNQPNWSETKNKEIFGACYSPFGHGHNYKIIIKVALNKDYKAEEFQVEFKNIMTLLDHKHLNHEIDFFKDKIPTTENIALFIKKELVKSGNIQNCWTKFKLFETESIWVEIEND